MSLTSHVTHSLWLQEVDPDETVELPPNTPVEKIKIVVIPDDVNAPTQIAVDVFACYEEGI